MANKSTPKTFPVIRFNIDRGGTFTDIYAEVVHPDNSTSYEVFKLLSEDKAYPNAPREGIRQIINKVNKKWGVAKSEIGILDLVPTDQIDWIRMGTTVATNALLERNSQKKYDGELPPPQRVVLVTTKGFRDLLQIGNQSRPDIFDLTCRKPELLYANEFVIEVDERVLIRADISAEEAKNSPQFEVLPNGEVIQIEKGIPTQGSNEWQDLVEQLKKPLEKQMKSVAVVFLHSYCYQKHERQIGELCKSLGYQYISLSSDLSTSVKAVARGHTSTVDAFLTPYLKSYIDGFKSGFSDSISDVNVSFMKSDGGLCPVQNFTGYVSILSGPAGGVVGYSRTSTTNNNSEKTPEQVVGFDMGGTSTDVSRVHGDQYHYVHETELDGVFIQAPQLDINTVAAGGGSVLHFLAGNMTVGPDSAGSNPGPVCYNKNGQNLTVTDANFFLGRIIQQYFPFPLSLSKVEQAFTKLTETINSYHKEKQLSLHQIAFGYLDMANEIMASAIKKITEARGYDVTKHVLSAFGGAGSQHACAIARSLGITKVHVNRFCSVLSAYGLGLADEQEEQSEPCRVNFEYAPENFPEIEFRLEILREKSIERLRTHKHVEEDKIIIKKFLNLRYQGTDTVLSIEEPSDKNYKSRFVKEYHREFGFTMEQNQIVVDSLKVTAIAKAPHVSKVVVPKSTSPPKPEISVGSYFKNESGEVYQCNTDVYIYSNLGAGDKIHGPSFIVDPKYYLMIVVEPGCTATISEHGHVEIDVPKNTLSGPASVDAVSISLFIHRFMAIAEQMGVSLQKTAKSVNIKERLDFSCALFNHEGGLVANAPHLPVHLGAMAHAVKYQIQNCPNWKEGEVVLSNHPAAGGSHLPDFTVITPVYYKGEPCKAKVNGKDVDLTKPIFYVASRAHHADIGGIAPGSMPPFSKELVQEGAATKSMKITQNGIFLEKEVIEFLLAPGKQPGVFPAAHPIDNIDDLKAQIAANKKGIDLVHELINNYGISFVLDMMSQVQLAAENAVREMLKDFAREKLVESPKSENGILRISAEDMMDDGLTIKLVISINSNTGDTTFDFTGTSPESYGNLNAPTSVTSSAIIYALRSLVKKVIPLNQGCMNPITIIIPKFCFLSPSDTAAVVGGNVLTSQRITDVILAAFGAQANSQGCMNNFTFGGPGLPSYYETISGGCGAGPTWDGQSAVQSHMTNTRITDPEVLERRFQVKLLEFSVRKNSGGAGATKGGDGVVRKVQFLKGQTASILSERRTLAPNGIFGGEPGKRGANYLIKNYGQPNERKIYLGPKNTIPVDKGDVFCIETPGGGGYGKPTENKN